MCADIWGPTHYVSHNGYKYYVSFVDYYTCFNWNFLMKLKSDVHHIFSTFLPFIERSFNSKLITLQIDGSGEFKPLTSICKQLGITYRSSCPPIHQHNGLVECKHHPIVEIGLALLAHSSLPFAYWAEAFEIAVSLINLLPTPNL